MPLNVGENRGNWPKSIYGTLALCSQAVGFGNATYFQYYIGTYGSSFFISYFVVYFFIGVPLFAVEAILGQYLSIGPIRGLSTMAPALAGIGWGMVINTSIICIHYNYLVTFTLLLFGKKFLGDNKNSEDSFCNASSFTQFTTSNDRYIMTTAYLGTWILIAISIIRGLHNSCKLLILMFLLPFALLILLVILHFYKISGESFLSNLIESWNVEELKNITMWLDALRQVLFSFGVGCGTISTISSFNKAKHNVILNVFLVPAIDCVVSILLLTLVLNFFFEGEIVSVSSMLCYYFKKAPMGKNSCIFFFALFVFGLATQITMTEAVVTGIIDQYPKLNKRHWLVVCITCAILSSFGVAVCLLPQIHILVKAISNILLLTLGALIGLTAPILLCHFEQIKNDLSMKISRVTECYLIGCWILQPALFIFLFFYFVFFLIKSKSSFSTASILAALFMLGILARSLCKCYRLSFKDIFRPDRRNFRTVFQRNESERATPAITSNLD